MEHCIWTGFHTLLGGGYNQSSGNLILSNNGTASALTLGTGSTISGGNVGFVGTGNILDIATGGAFNPAATINLSAGNTFNVSGGTATLNSADTWNANGTVNLTAGNLTLDGITSNGIYTQTSGTGALHISNTGTASTLTLGTGSTISAGTVDFVGTGNTLDVATGGAFNPAAAINISANNTFKVSGGNATLNGTGAGADTWAGLVNVTGGTLTLDKVTNNATTTGGAFSQSNGTVNVINESSLTAFASSITGGQINVSSATATKSNLGLVYTADGVFNTNVQLQGYGILTLDTNGHTVTNTSDINGTGVGNELTKTGLGTYDFNLSGFTGNKQIDYALNVNQGTMIVTSPNSGSLTFTNPINLGNGALTGTLNLNAGSASSITLNSAINSTSLANVINLNNAGSGTINVNNNINNSTVNLYNGTMALANESYINGNNLGLYGGILNTQNGMIGTMALNNVVFGGNSSWLMDVDLANAIGDKITSATPVSGAGGLNISGIKLFSDANAVNTAVTVADTNTKGNVSTSVSSVNGALFTYGVSYSGAGTNGVLNFVKTGVSPNATTGDVSQTQTFLLQTAIDRQFFGNVDAFMSFPLAARESTICCALAHDPSSGYTGGACPLSGNGTFSPIYSCDLNKGIWVKDFVSFENIPLVNGPNVSTVEYGTLIGADAPLKHLGHGIVGNTSAYVGYLGSNQNYGQVGVSQNGVLVGLAENMVYKNTFLTLMASVGSSLGNSITPYGTDHFSSLFAGCAAKGGYNFEFKDGEYILQPNLMMAYTFTNTPDYTTASGLNMSSKPLNAMQIAPGVRLIKNMRHEKGQVYLVANMVFNVMDKTNFTANDVQLPQLSIAPYIEYGIGYQRVWKERLTGFAQTLFRGGGRNGVALQFGLRWVI